MKQILCFTLLIALCSSCAVANKKNDNALIFSTKADAIEGYDPVAYFNDSKPVKGQDNIVLKWNDATWHFASLKNRDLFQRDPEKYAPQYGGWCAYGWAQGYPAKIDPQAWSIVDGKLYLNYDLNVQKDWNQKQAAYILSADKNYAKAHKGE